MYQPDEVRHYGAGYIASLAARCRSSGNRSTGAYLETWFGEARRWDDRGQTMYATFPSPWLMDQSRRCHSGSLYQAYSPSFDALESLTERN